MRPAAGGGGSVFRGACIGLTWLWLAAFALVPAFALMLVSLLDKGDGEFFIPVLTLDNYRELFVRAGMGRFQHQVAIRSPEAVEIHKANRDAKHDDEGSSSEPAQEQNRFRQRLQCWQTLKGAGTEVHDDH